MNVIAWSQNLTKERAGAAGARLVSKEEIFRESDIITIHLVLSHRSRGIVGRSELTSMKPTAHLINAARGPIVDEAALIEVLKARKIAGAGLDVFDIEPLPPEHPFRQLPNVLATPHLGYGSRSLYATFYRDSVENIKSWIYRTTGR
jgi:phosphoglycerate dehydrogenase-like enzyme